MEGNAIFVTLHFTLTQMKQEVLFDIFVKKCYKRQDIFKNKKNIIYIFKQNIYTYISIKYLLGFHRFINTPNILITKSVSNIE